MSPLRLLVFGTCVLALTISPTRSQWQKYPRISGSMAPALLALHDGRVLASCGDSLVLIPSGDGMLQLLRFPPVLGLVRSMALLDSGFAVGAEHGFFAVMPTGAGWQVTDRVQTTSPVNALVMVNGSLLAGTEGGEVLVRGGAQAPVWGRKFASDVGPVTALALSGNSVLASTKGHGVFRTQDGGRTWAQANNGLKSLFILALKASDSLILAGGIDGSISFSTNAGTRWRVADSGLPFAGILSIEIDEGNYIAGTWGKGIFLSTGRGGAWRDVNPGLPGNGSYEVRACLAAGERIVIATADGIWMRPAWQLFSKLGRRSAEDSPSYLKKED